MTNEEIKKALLGKTMTKTILGVEYYREKIKDVTTRDDHKGVVLWYDDEHNVDAFFRLYAEELARTGKYVWEYFDHKIFMQII